MSIILQKPPFISDIKQFGKYIVSHKKGVTLDFFAQEFGKLRTLYERNHQEDYFCQQADILADKLVQRDRLDFAGIVMSTLCKVNEYFPHNLEYFAQKGYDISRMNGDYVHMMARLNDLRKIYSKKPDRLLEYLDVLYEQERCLKHVTMNYRDSVASYRTISRKASPRQSYEMMLAFIQTEIAKLTRRKHPESAMYKLQSAMRIFEKNQSYDNANYTELLMRKIEAGDDRFIDMYI